MTPEACDVDDVPLFDEVGEPVGSTAVPPVADDEPVVSPAADAAAPSSAAETDR